jgi:hypothetical protein
MKNKGRNTMIREKFIIFSLLRFVVIAFSLVMIIKPQIGWWVVEGWKYKKGKVKPNKLVLLLIRFLGVIILAAIVASFFFMFQK